MGKDRIVDDKKNGSGFFRRFKEISKSFKYPLS